jgi:hypothetical protein
MGAQIAQQAGLSVSWSVTSMPAGAVLASNSSTMGISKIADVTYNARLHMFKTTGDERYRPSGSWRRR